MSDPKALLESAREFVGDTTISAAGVLGLQDNYKTIAAFGAATALLPDGNVGVEALEGVGAVEVSRAVEASSQELSTRMLVAVSSEKIYLLALPRFAGDRPDRLLLALHRSEVEIKIRKFGFSRHLNISQGDRIIRLTAVTRGLSSQKTGDKAVLAALGFGD